MTNEYIVGYSGCRRPPPPHTHPTVIVCPYQMRMEMIYNTTISPVILDEKLTNFGKKTYRAEFFRIDAKYSQGQHTKSPQKSPRWQIRK